MAHISVNDLDLTEDLTGVAGASSEDVRRASVMYYITSGDVMHQFQVKDSGQVYVNGQLDREVKDNYVLGITATDGMFVTQTRVKITVVDVNGECLFRSDS